MATSILEELRVKIGADVQPFERGLKRTEGKMKGFERKMGGIAAAIGSVFAVGEAINFGKQVVATTAKFEKLNAVLSNSLGSDASADLAFQRIQEFASKTPFQIEELTGSFVKLVGQGIRPTMAEMTKLGDLAASQGKSFDQLAEGILDATTGEFERLKEFGIRASKQGDKVAFTFKGVTKTVDNTSQAIEDYIYSLGEAEGVSGSMADISNTLGGKISNLSDQFTTFQANLGKMNKGPLSATLDYFIKLTEAANRLVSTDMGGIINSVGIEEAEANLKKLEDRLKEIYKQNERVKNMTLGEAKEAEARGEDVQFIGQSGIDMVTEAIKRQKEVIATLKKEKEDAAAAALKQAEADKKAAEQAEIDKGILGRLQDELKKVKDLRDTSNSEAEIAAYNLRAEKIDREIKKLQELGKIKEMPVAAGIGFNFEALELPELPDMSGMVTQIGEQTQAVSDQFNQMASAIEGAMASAITNFADGLGQLIATGQGLDPSMLLGPIASMLGQLGQMAIAAGVATMGIKAALESLNPVAAIVGGLALVALSSAIRGSMKGLSRGMGGGGGSISGGGNAKPAANIGSQGSDGNNQIEFIIKGNNLVGALTKAQQQRFRLS